MIMDTAKELHGELKPVVLQPNWDGMPEELKQLKAWLVWKLEYHADLSKRWTKIPYAEKGAEVRRASSTDPKTWRSFETAKFIFESSDYDGVGIVLQDGIDQWGLRIEYLCKHSVDVDRFYLGLDSGVYDTDIAAHYQNRLTRNRERLFEFLNHDGVPWNDNNAENAVKAYAKYREFAGNLCTCAGLEDYLVLLSIQQTCKYRGISFLEFLRSGRRTFDA